MYLLAFEQIITKLFAQLNRNISECTFAAAELLEVVAYTIPLFVSLACLLPEVGKEIYLLFVLVKKSNSSLMSDCTRMQRLPIANSPYKLIRHNQWERRLLPARTPSSLLWQTESSSGAPPLARSP